MAAGRPVGTVGNTVTGFTGSIYCYSNYDKSGMRKIMADSKWSKVHLSNNLEATMVGPAAIGGLVLGPIGAAYGRDRQGPVR